MIGNRVVTPAQIFPPRRFPRFPIFFGLPGFGFAGRFFGGYDSACGPFWIWGFACDKLPYFGFGYSSYSSAPQPNSTEAVLWLKDGTVYGLRGYWFVAGKLYYVTNYGGENSIDMDRVDLQKTVTVKLGPSSSPQPRITRRSLALGSRCFPARPRSEQPQRSDYCVGENLDLSLADLRTISTRPFRPSVRSTFTQVVVLSRCP